MTVNLVRINLPDVTTHINIIYAVKIRHMYNLYTQDIVIYRMYWMYAMYTVDLQYMLYVFIYC